MGSDEKSGAESSTERANRELMELLNELRVALPGVQVLFAFLLTVPFTQRFTELDTTDRRVYYISVVTTAAATLFLIAPTAHHRLRFRSRVKEQLLRVANVLALIGVALLAVSISAVTYLITDLVYDATAAAIAAGCLAGAFAIVWFVLPFLYRPEPTPAPRSAADGG
jgi:peptidoglycan biosynthesis protein MviN/MurJ (putative lipid II flippase)